MTVAKIFYESACIDKFFKRDDSTGEGLLSHNYSLLLFLQSNHPV